MKTWRIEAKTEGREVYYVQAETEEECRRAFEDGDLPDPSVSEVLYAEIENVEEASE